MKKKAKKTAPMLAPELDDDDESLMTRDDLEHAQRWVCRELLAGRLDVRESRARTSALTALAHRMRDADNAK